jgi:hypothetical protein
MANWKIFPEAVEEVNIQYTPFLQSRKFFAVDDSGSTAGAILRRERAFVDKVREGHANSDDAISLWGSACDAPSKNFDTIHWLSRHGGTQPSEIFNCQPALDALRGSDVWFLLTDGEIWSEDVHRLANIAQDREVLNIPLVFLITGARGSTPSATNISVGISFFATSQDTLILFKETSTGKIFVIASKGCFASLGGSAAAQDLESWNALQVFNTEAAFFAQCAKLEIHVVQAEHRAGSAKGISLGTEWEEGQGGAVRVDLDLLPKAGFLSDDDLISLTADDTFDTLAVAYKTRSRIAELRGFLQKQKIEQVAPKLEDVSGAGAIIAKMGDAKTTEKERKKLQERLRAAHTMNRDHYQKSAAEFAGSQEEKKLRKRNHTVDAALRTLASIEAAGFNAEILSRKSNRARRAEVVETASAIDITKFDLDAPAYKGFCQICCGEEEVMSICFKEMEADKIEDNTTDFALNFPLAAGAATKNIELVSSQNICFQCASLAPDSKSIYREPLIAVVPTLQYDVSNKKYINDQLYLALTARLATGAAGIAQLFMSILQELVTTKSWAGSDWTNEQLGAGKHNETRQRRQTLEWMLNQLIDNTWTREDFKESGGWVKYPQALSWVAKDFETNGLASFAVTYPALGFNNLVALGIRTGAFSEDHIRLMKSAKVVHSIAAKYLAELQVALQNRTPDEEWKQKYLEVIYHDFNGPLVPRDRSGGTSLVSDADADLFTQRLNVCIKDNDFAGGADVIRKVQIILFWLLFRQKGHCTAQTFFTRMREDQTLGITVLDPKATLPRQAHQATLLSIFASHDTTLIDAKAAARHVSAVIPFANPFGASVLRCGVDGCGVKFCNAKAIKGDDLNLKTVQKIRDARTKHLITVFGISTRFEKSTTGLPERTHPHSPSSLHMNLHISIVREWCAHSVPERKLIVTSSTHQDQFVQKVRKRLCKEGRGNIYQDRLDRDTRSLLPSFWKVLARAMEMQGTAGEGKGIWEYEHDFDGESGVESKVRWELESESEGLGEWEMT